MKFPAARLITLLLLCAGCSCAFAQNYSNKGTDFWVAWMNHVRGASGNGASQMSLYLTSDVSTTGTVSVADGSFSVPFNITANQVTIINIPGSAFLSAQGQFLKGIHITSVKPIVVYAHIYAMAVSGATLVLPVSVLAKEYVSINYTQQSNEPNISYSAFTIIATEDDTRVEVTPVATLTDGKPAGQAFQLNLKKGEVYQGLSYNDLTGTRIRSVSVNGAGCKKIAVFSGAGKVFIGCYLPQAITSDNLFQQVYPQRAWGKNYVTVPLRNRAYDIYRIVLSDPATVVTLNGQAISPSAFTGGSFFEFQSTVPNVISADKPVQVVQYSISQRQGRGCSLLGNDLGDPEMIYLSPIEQSVNQVTLYSSGYFAIENHYINIIIKKETAASFRIDGRAPAGGFSPVPGNAAFVYGQFSVSAGTHQLGADDGFNAVAYGFGSAESYGYAAGTNVKDLKQNIQVESVERKQVVTSGCVNEDFSMLITLGFPTSKLTWDIGNGTDPVADINPSAVNTFEKEGQTFYQYRFPGKSIYARSGNYTVKVQAFNPVADECGSTEDISLDLNIYSPPAAKFFAPDKACLLDSVGFSDQSLPGEKQINTWQWDFGDGSSSALKNPKHLYAKEGTYRVRLVVKGETGCASSVFEKSLVVNPPPVADFILPKTGCTANAVTIINRSVISTGNIKLFVWDYGDGKTETFNDAGMPVLHTFSRAGTYTVTLKLTSEEGCSAVAVSKTVTIYDGPVAAFSVPKICASDVFAEFINRTETIDGQTLSYLWDFGDANATASGNRSTDSSPRHTYTRAGRYTVSLTVSTAEGCLSKISREITVNSTDISPAFDILNDQACSSNAVQVRDISSLGFGQIIKIEWDWGDGSAPETDENPERQKQYTHRYTAFSSPATKTFAVKLKVYSGQTCMAEVSRTVTLKAVPAPVFENLKNSCVDAVGYQVNVSTAGFTGQGAFSGPGINRAGYFDPAKAGPGVHTISYQFTPDNGCIVSKAAQVTVDALPGIKLATDTTMLEGGQVVLRPKISGANLTYKWSPAVGLSRDDVADPVASPRDATTYTLTVSSLAGCVATAKIHVTVLKMPVVPNTFTPNGDGVNDAWTIKYLSTYRNCIVEIFNRYGKKVYNSVGYPAPWDGRVNNGDLPTGVYYYTIDPKNGRKMLSGYVTIIR